MPSQQLLTPEFIEVDGDDMTLLLERQDIFTDLGYATLKPVPRPFASKKCPATYKMAISPIP